MSNPDGVSSRSLQWAAGRHSGYAGLERAPMTDGAGNRPRAGPMQKFSEFDLTELKLVYRVLHQHLMEHLELMAGRRVLRLVESPEDA